MRVVSWNVAGRSDGPRARALAAQAAAVADERPDVVALQEVTRETEPAWQAALAEIGLEYVTSSTSLLRPGRRYANLLAARWPLQPGGGADEPELDFPEKLLAATLTAPELELEVHVFHAPTGVGSGWGKIRALEALHRRLTTPATLPRFVCGDFNTPQVDRPGARPVTFAQDAATGDLRPKPERWYRKIEPDVPWDPVRWDRAERQVLECDGTDLVDAFRALHPQRSEATWVWRGRGREIGRRFDHVFVSPEIDVTSLAYRHEWREPVDGRRLSDHSGVVVDVAA